MARRKTRLQAADAYSEGVKAFSTNPHAQQCGWLIARAFIDGAKWQQNRSQKRAAGGKE